MCNQIQWVLGNYLFRLITAHRQCLGQGNILCTCLSFCSWGGEGVVSQHALQVVTQHDLQQVSWRVGVVSQHALQQVSWGGGIPACLAGGIPACLAGLQGEGVSRPTPRGEVEGSGWGGGGLQAHTWGACSPPGMHSCSKKIPPVPLIT